MKIKTKIVIKNPSKAPEVIEVLGDLSGELSLETLQGAVGGYIEKLPQVSRYYEELRGLTLLVNEEGRLNGMGFNCLIAPYGDIVGPVVCCAVAGDALIGLSDEQAKGIVAFLEDL